LINRILACFVNPARPVAHATPRDSQTLERNGHLSFLLFFSFYRCTQQQQQQDEFISSRRRRIKGRKKAYWVISAALSTVTYNLAGNLKTKENEREDKKGKKGRTPIDSEREREREREKELFAY
jgi:hypothetical protein